MKNTLFEMAYGTDKFTVTEDRGTYYYLREMNYEVNEEEGYKVIETRLWDRHEAIRLALRESQDFMAEMTEKEQQDVHFTFRASA